MAKKEGKGFDLAAALADVSSLDTGAGTGPDKIVYVPLDKLHEDPNNFYDIDGIEDLASNIELVGLQQPPRVRPDPDHPGEYILISGHRRRAAYQLLADEGKEQFKTMPVIPEAAADTDALQELKLILANSSTRKMSSVETAKQAERIQELVYQLKEQYGEEYFPGRMRDYVAEACQISASRLARLKVIREKLIEELRPPYESGGLNETVAYAIAKHNPEWQRRFCRYRASAKYSSDSKNWAEYHVKDAEKLFTALDELTCRQQAGGGKCDYTEALMLTAANKGMYHNCGYGKCCASCSQLVSCKNACSRLAGQVAKLKAEAKDAKASAKRASDEAARIRREGLSLYWDRLGKAIEAAGVSPEKAFESINGYTPNASALEVFTRELAFEGLTQLPYGWKIDLDTATRLKNTAQLLGCSTDYLLGASEDMTPQEEAPGKKWLHLSFIDALRHPVPDEDMLAETKLFFCIFDCGDGVSMPTTAKWANGWCFPHNLASIDAKCLKYFPLPKDEEAPDHEADV